MDVSGVGSVNGPLPIQPTRPAAEPVRADAARPISTNDSLEISAAGRMLEQASQASEIRAERLNEIKAAIAEGTYETAEKLEAALTRLFDEAGLRFEDEA